MNYTKDVKLAMLEPKWFMNFTLQIPYLRQQQMSGGWWYPCLIPSRGYTVQVDFGSFIFIFGGPCVSS
jgi:hypothetical protein